MWEEAESQPILQLESERQLKLEIIITSPPASSSPRYVYNRTLFTITNKLVSNVLKPALPPRPLPGYHILVLFIYVYFTLQMFSSIFL